MISLAFLVGVVFAIVLVRGLDIAILSSSEVHLKRMAVSCENHKGLKKSLEKIEDSEISKDAFILSKRALGLACELEVYESFLISKGIDPVVLKAKIKVLKSND